MRKLFLVPVLLCLGPAVFPQTPAQPAAAAQTAIQRAVQEAQAKGVSEVTIGPRIYDAFGTTDDLSKALEHFTVVIVQPIDSIVALTPSGIESWYRCELLETLQQRPFPFAKPFPQLPGLPALSKGQFWVHTFGGTITVDQVKVTERQPLQLEPDQHYLLFVAVDANHVAEVAGHAAGAFRLLSGNALVPVREEQAGKAVPPLVASMRQQLHNSLAKLRDEINARHSPR